MEWNITSNNNIGEDMIKKEMEELLGVEWRYEVHDEENNKMESIHKEDNGLLQKNYKCVECSNQFSRQKKPLPTHAYSQWGETV
ncbi:hypothetical protein Pmani_029809 [Petrolisthes manimaculis]|uniref:C2H2-type domain-containing protein n=1 Tax=Petrolisthes manimaculis TaxID=1843537 RepID=A0AAE1NZF2_9EUCA|nr:hypothetical protein Pmani_029809 [Petrolisthes manimaculis]